MKDKRNKLVSQLILFAMVISMILLPVKITPAATIKYEGEGTEASPYLIRTINQLRNICKHDYDAYYKLMNDIDLGDVPISGIITPGFMYGGVTLGFAGTFDGNGHKIKRMHVEGSGLFSSLEYYPTIKNLILEDPVVVSTGHNSDLTYGAGALAGTVNCSVTITNCSVINGNITGEDIVGGLIGYSHDQDIKISQCSFTGNVTSVKGIAGGLVGSFKNRTDIYKYENKLNIDQCYTVGNIKAANSAGGIIGKGDNGIKISNCYSVSNLQSAGEASGIGDKANIKNSYFAGTIESPSASGLNKTGFISNSYFNSSLSTVDSPYGLTTEQMYEKMYFSNWDFKNIWFMEEEQDYPRLRLQKAMGGFDNKSLEINMVIGQELKLSVNALNEAKSLVWTSSDPTVAAIDAKGVAKAIKNGTSVITAETADHSFTKKITITVQPGGQI